jgi:hypothetical protein
MAVPEDDNVCRLLMGIQTPSLQSAVLFVCSSPALCGNFNASVDFITTVVETIKDSTKISFSQISLAAMKDEEETESPTSGRGFQCHIGGRGGWQRLPRPHGRPRRPWTWSGRRQRVRRAMD